MRSTTNLHWPTEPFGAAQRPFAPDRPMMAAVTVGLTGYVPRPQWASVVYLSTDSTRTVEMDGQILNFGFEVLTSQPHDSPAALPERLDEILVACRRHAKILAGHDLAGDLASLTAFGLHRRLPGVDGVRRQWSTRHATERGTAMVIDTAHDIDPLGTADLAAVCEHTALKAATLAAPHGMALAATVRQAVVRTLAIALLAAHITSRYRWTSSVDLDELVADSAWDHLHLLAEKPADATTP